MKEFFFILIVKEFLRICTSPSFFISSSFLSWIHSSFQLREFNINDFSNYVPTHSFSYSWNSCYFIGSPFLPHDSHPLYFRTDFEISLLRLRFVSHPSLLSTLLLQWCTKLPRSQHSCDTYQPSEKAVPNSVCCILCGVLGVIYFGAIFILFLAAGFV